MARELADEEEFAHLFSASARSPMPRPALAKPTTQDDTVSSQNRKQQKTTRDDTATLKAGLKVLRETLRDIGFYSKTHFKVDAKFESGYLWIRQFKSHAGEPETVASTRATLNLLASAARMTPEKFRAEFTEFLREREFRV